MLQKVACYLCVIQQGRGQCTCESVEGSLIKIGSSGSVS